MAVAIMDLVVWQKMRGSGPGLAGTRRWLRSIRPSLRNNLSARRRPMEKPAGRSSEKAPVLPRRKDKLRPRRNPGGYHGQPPGRVRASPLPASQAKESSELSFLFHADFMTCLFTGFSWLEKTPGACKTAHEPPKTFDSSARGRPRPPGGVCLAVGKLDAMDAKAKPRIRMVFRRPVTKGAIACCGFASGVFQLQIAIYGLLKIRETLSY